MRKQSRLAKHLLAHRFQIMESRLIPEPLQGLAHLGKNQLRLVSQAEQRLCASHAFACAHHFHNLVWHHRVRARLTGIAAEGAVTAVVSTKICERKKYHARISN